MKKIRLSLGLLALILPATGFAASTVSTAITKDAILSNLVKSDTAIQVAAPAEVSISARPMSGGGGDMKMSSILPYYGNGVTVDVQVTREVSPQIIHLNAWCQLPDTGTRQEVRAALDAIYKSLKDVVGGDGRLRRQGGYSINPYYDPMGKSSNLFQGNLGVLIRINKASAAGRIAAAVEDAGCSSNWDVRMKDMQTFEASALDELVSKLNQRKELFEKLLGKKLTTVASASLNTYIDGYNSYDPDSNTADAVTSLTVVFDLGGRSAQPLPTSLPGTK